MAQFSKGDTFTNGEQVTGTRLNQLVDSATLLVGAITDHPSITANTLEATDSTIVNDAGVLKEATIGDFLNSNLPITTSSVTSGNTSDILITPNDGTIVTGQAYTSGDGLTVTVTSTAHTLALGQVILVSSAGSGYNGTFRVATVSTNSFTYVMTTAATAGSGTLSYIKKGAVKNAGSEIVDGSLFVAGKSVIATSDVTGNLTVAGTSTLTGATSMTSATVSGNLTVSGTINNSGLQPVIKVALLTNELTNGQTYSITAGSWNNIPYNTIVQTSAFVVNSASFTGVLSSAGSGTITLPAGTYVVEAEASIQSGGGSGAITARVYNSTTSTLIKNGVTTYCASYSHGLSIVFAVFTLTEQQSINIQYYANVAASTSTISYAPSPSPEVAFTAKITKLA